jgi:hypothetical protein
MASPTPPTIDPGNADPQRARIAGRWSWACRRGLLALLVFALLGCGGGTTVSGTVTYGGREVDKGFITFFPADGKGDTRGAKIVQGRYQLTDLPPGKKRVLISSEPDVVVLPGSRHGAPRVRLKPPEIPPQSPGNNQVVEITGGNQTLDFNLQKPR